MELLNSESSFLISLCILLFSNLSLGHVRLTFPPARQYSLDFLDNQRTYQPCGMSKGGQTTILKEGSTFNVTWHMGLLHQGNYQIEIIRENSSVLELLPWSCSTGFLITTQSQEVTLPKGLTCSNCTIRLLRQAREFGDDYIFWSCADIDILDSVTYQTYQRNLTYRMDLFCLGRGYLSSGLHAGETGTDGNICICNKGFTGSRCEFETECDVDKDCGNNGQGKCIMIGTSNQCFCKHPYFGQKCSKVVQPPNGYKTVVPLPNFQTLNLSEFRVHKLSDDVTLHHKTIYASSTKPQIEFVLVINGTSYGGLGWRPLNLNKSCKAHWPHNSRAKNLQLPVTPNLPHDVKTKNKKFQGDKYQGIVEAFNAEKLQILAQSSSSSEASLPADLIQTHEIERAPFKAMDCTDMVIGTARGGYSRFGDYYTMDRSTPQMDNSFWGGTDDIMGATGWETGSKTTLVFRKQIWSQDVVTDHDLSGNLLMIWSRGQELSNVDYPLDSAFYAKDELKYHGYGKNQRGFLVLRLDEN